MTNIGELNIVWGWIWMVLGILSGSVIGMWAFAGPMKTPPGHHDYGDLPRRMVRLGHIALFMLPLINVAYGHRIDLLPISETLKVWGSYGMLVCMFGVPTFLFIGSVYLPAKYLEAIPVGAGILALGIMSYGNILML